MRYLLIVWLAWSVCPLATAQIEIETNTPTSNAILFAPGIVSTNLNQRDIAISPDGTEIYYTHFRGGFDGNILFIKKEGDLWSLPEIASFSGDQEDIEPAFSPNGNRLYFSSRRGGSDYDIWYVERDSDGNWGSPIDVGSPINTSVNEFYPSVVNDGSMYYTAAYDNGIGGEDIWYTQLVDGVYQTPVPVSGVSTGNDEFNAYIDPSEQFMYFSSFGRSDGLGGGDLYISRKSGGAWGQGVNLGNRINSENLDYCGVVSPDGRFLYFTSERRNTSNESSNNPFDLSAVLNSILTPNKTSSSIYWIKR